MTTPATGASSHSPRPEIVQGVEISVRDAAISGSTTARVALIELSDYQCPYCGPHARDTLSHIRRDFIDPGKIAYVFLNVPLENIHPAALRAAEAAECAGEQQKYWQMHESLFQNQRALTDSAFAKYAAAIGLDMPRFVGCLSQGRAEKIRRQMEDGRTAGVTSTPVFFIGEMNANGRVRLSHRFKGALPYAVFKSTLDQVLSSPQLTSRR